MGDFVSKDASLNKERAVQEPLFPEREKAIQESLLWDSPQQLGEAVGQIGVLAATGQQGIRDFTLYALDIDDELATVFGKWQENYRGQAVL